MKFNKLPNLIAFAVILVCSLSFSTKALAASPILSLSSTGDGDSVQINVTADPNKSVVFYYNKIGSGPQISFIGNTDSNGSLSTNISAATYGISANDSVHVSVNGQTSANTIWPNVVATSLLSLDQTSIVLPLGQSYTINAYNNGANSIYLSNNSNPPVANVSISGNKILVTANNYGSSIIMLCSGVNNPICASAYIKVQNTGAQPLTFSQTNTTVASGQTMVINVLGGTGSYMVLSNSNPNIFQAVVNGSSISLSAQGTTGYSALTICSLDMSACGIINATVGNANSTPLTFSQTNPIMSVNQSMTVSVIGGTGGTYSIFSNSSSSVASANLNGGNLMINALAGGSTVVTVCSSMGSCGSLSITVNFSLANGGPIALSQNNLWLSAGQTLNITISGGSLPYSVLNSTTNFLQTSLSGNTLSITGLTSGSASINVCSAGGGCTILSVLVNGVSATTALSFSQSNVNLNIGSNATVYLFGNGGYFVSYNANPGIATSQISGSNIIFTGVAAGTDSISVCQNGGQCGVITINVSPAPIVVAPPLVVVAPPVAITPAVVAPVSTSVPAQVKFKFVRNIFYGSTSNDVLQLQKRLKLEGIFKGPATGKFGALTRTAVRAYQKIKGISQTGNVGNLTMAALNK